MDIAIYYADLDEDMRDRLLAVVTAGMPGVFLRQVALSLHVDDAALAPLAADGPQAVRCALARHPHTPQAVLETLAQDSDPWVLWFVSRRHRLPPAVATALLTNPVVYQDTQVAAAACYGALACPTLDPAVVARAAQHPSPWVQDRARQHPQYPGTPAETEAGAS